LRKRGYKNKDQIGTEHANTEHLQRREHFFLHSFKYFLVNYVFRIAIHIGFTIISQVLFLSVRSWAIYRRQCVPSSKFSPWLKSLVTPLNTRGTGAAHRSLIKAFSHKDFWESRFHAPICFQWKAVTREHHTPKFYHA